MIKLPRHGQLHPPTSTPRLPQMSLPRGRGERANVPKSCHGAACEPPHRYLSSAGARQAV